MLLRIGLLVPSYVEFSGDARVAELQIKELKAKGHQVEIFALMANMFPNGTRVVALGMPKNSLLQRLYRLFLPLNFFLTLRWLYLCRNLDFVICHLYPMTWLAFMSKLLWRKPYVFWFHGIEEPVVFSKTHERIYMRLIILLTKITTSNVDVAVSVSNFAKEKLEKFTGLQSQVIYNKADTTRFHSEIDGSKVREMHHLDNFPVILFVGRLAPQKGIHLLVQAFEFVRHKVPNARLVLVGDATFPYYFKQLKTISSDSVLFVGHVSTEEMPFYYAACDIYATCSLWENCNMPVLEAMACGKRVVAFDIDAFKELSDHGITIVERNNIKQFAEACIRLLQKTEPRDSV